MFLQLQLISEYLIGEIGVVFYIFYNTVDTILFFHLLMVFTLYLFSVRKFSPNKMCTFIWGPKARGDPYTTGSLPRYGT